MIDFKQLKRLIVQDKQEMFFQETHKEKAALKMQQERIHTQFLANQMAI